jgi:hypothetical protein
MYNDGRPKRHSIQAHLAVDELETRSRRAIDPMARSRWQVIWLLARGLLSAPVAAVTGYMINWMRTLARRDNQLGPAGLEDRRHCQLGATGVLAPVARSALAAALQQPLAGGGV